jgi:sugar lactone lactonase YvrE
VLITPGGAVRQAADEIAFPDGMAATPDNSSLNIAESFGGRLTAYDIVTGRQRCPTSVVGRGVRRDGICLHHRGRP